MDRGMAGSGVVKFPDGSIIAFLSQRIWEDGPDPMCHARMILDGDSIPSDYILLDINPAMEKVLGLSREQVIGQSFDRLFPGLDLDWLKICAQLVRSGQALPSLEHILPPDRWYATRVFAQDSLDEFVTLSRDITVQKQAEQALRESEERQRFLFDLGEAVRLLTDPAEVQAAIAGAVMDYFGADRCYYCEIKSDQLIICGDAANGDLPSVEGVYPLGNYPVHKGLIEAGQPIIAPDIRTTDTVDEDARQILIQLGIMSYLDIPVLKAGSPVGFLGITQASPRNWTAAQVDMARDVAERFWAEMERARAGEAVRKARDYLEEKVAERTRELAFERQRLFEVLETLPNNICLIAPDHTVPFANRAFRERFGEANGRPCYDYFCGSDQPCGHCESLRPLETGRPHHWTCTGPDGSIMDVHDFPFNDADGRSMVLKINVDITEQRRIEAEMARLDRLNLIGQMAAGIGHEIRNPMTAVRGFLQVLGEKAEYSEDLAFFELMIEELDRANTIISGFLGLARDKMVDLQPGSLDHVVRALYPMLRSEANLREIEVVLELQEPAQILFDESEIRQLILNISRNAMEATPLHGTVTIGTWPESGETVLYIRDQGSGLAPEIIDRLGTPFVTTKENGTGLGLAICYSIAARHNARMDFETGPEGTTFYVRFPAGRRLTRGQVEKTGGGGHLIIPVHCWKSGALYYSCTPAQTRLCPVWIQPRGPGPEGAPAGSHGV